MFLAKSDMIQDPDNNIDSSYKKNTIEGVSKYGVLTLKDSEVNTDSNSEQVNEKAAIVENNDKGDVLTSKDAKTDVLNIINNIFSPCNCPHLTKNNDKEVPQMVLPFHAKTDHDLSIKIDDPTQKIAEKNSIYSKLGRTLAQMGDEFDADMQKNGKYFEMEHKLTQMLGEFVEMSLHHIIHSTILSDFYI